MKIKTAASSALVAAQWANAGLTKRSCDCPDTKFTPITAQEWVAAANPGWNVGNTLDAVPNEGSWNNLPLQGSTLDTVKAAGYKSVRIPVTYTDHFVSSSPEWAINSTWLQRVSDVVDMATSRGLYVITNIHHDSWAWADVAKFNANQTQIQGQFYAAWLQIAKKLHCKPSMVALEPINEPTGSTEQDSDNLMKLNDQFLKALADSGGYNKQRVVTLSGTGMSIDKVQWFKRPQNITNPWAFQFHFYSPYDFVFGAWGKTIWGSDADKAAVVADLASIRGNFTDVPLIMGEFSASHLNCEAAARWKWYDHVVSTATSLNITTFLWDNGLDNLDRYIGKWRDPVSIEVSLNAARGVRNSLPDSTTDASATSQSSSAYIFNKVGSPVADRSVPFILNGNSFKSLAVEDAVLKDGTDFVISGSTVTFKESFLSSQGLSATASPGTKANVTVEFSAGAASQVELVQWDVPTLGSYSASAKAVSGGDFWIPVMWKGLHMVAAVKIATSDGAYLVDDWTQWLPTLQKGRGTFNSHWNFDHDHITITKNAIDAVIASGKNTTFTLEFYPRAEGNGNMIDYTFTI
ncbi:glycoside hydrolase superfamily [Podospora didyma]|uniref:Glycoside hydrolase superfamily n=1 Tax=Podospora didyma TaxID=330526 RepID=A0AAE0K5S7_9PEZI|nr:glycoside hydrolase superfamily [Podospora didyma]